LKYKIIEFKKGLYIGKITDFWYFGHRYVDGYSSQWVDQCWAECYPCTSIEEAEVEVKRAITQNSA
jgi:hypothetical protein